MRNLIRKILKESKDDLDWIRDLEPWTPLNKNIVIDFENDPNWYGWESEKSFELANKVVSKLRSFGYDKLDPIIYQLKGDPNEPYFCFIFLEYRKYAEDYNFVTWMACNSNVEGQEDINEFQRMTATQFLQMF